MEVESEKMLAPQSPAFLSAKKCQRDPNEHFSEPPKSGDHLFDRFYPRPTSGADFFSLRGRVPSRETTFLFIGRNIAKPYICSFLLQSGKIFTFAHVSKMFCGENKETKERRCVIMSKLLRCSSISDLVMYFSTLPSSSISAPCILLTLTQKQRVCRILRHTLFFFDVKYFYRTTIFT